MKEYRARLARGCACAEHLHDRVCEDEDLRAVQEPNSFIYSFRYVPSDLPEHPNTSAVDAYVDRLNQRITDELRFTGLAYVTTTAVRGNTAIRFSICSHRTTPADIDTTVDAIMDLGERIDPKKPDDFLSA